jgi:SAM-dependent methyltransferase
VLGVDLSGGMIRVATECAVPAGDARPEYRIMGAEALELPDGSFDAVISLCAVPHFPDVARALGEMRRVLRPGGRLVVSYGSVRPVSPLSLVRHVARRLLAGALHAVRPTLVGTGYLVRLTERMLPDTPETSGTEWGAGRRLAALVRTVAECGFEQLEVAWCGHEVLFDSAEEFWEAQAAIVTQVRKRLALSSTEAVEAVRQAFLKHASDVLQRGGKLVYPYGARFVAASAAR